MENNQPQEDVQTKPSNNTSINIKKHQVNKWIYVLLAFFLGSFGAHKFYADKVISGVIYLTFCWTAIPGILGILEAIYALFKTADSDGNIEV